MSRLGSFLQSVFAYGRVRGGNTFRENRLRPPGAVEEDRFMALCIRCNRCLEVCPYGSIKRAGAGRTMGTPFVFPEDKACYLCMACTRLCPTEALDTKLRNPQKVRMGKARIDTSLCYSHLFLDKDVLPQNAGQKKGALCNTCYNVCPLQDIAIGLKNNLFPVMLDGCVGCGICVERCPVRPRRAINVIPTGMGRVDEAGYFFRKARQRHDGTLGDRRSAPNGVLTGKDLLDQKYKIRGTTEKPTFRAPDEVDKTLEDWE